MKRTDLQSTLKDLEELLRRHEVSYAEVVQQLRQQVEADTDPVVSAATLNAVRGLFGGMGSLSDVYISKANGHAVEDEAAANQTLDTLTQALWQQVADEK